VACGSTPEISGASSRGPKKPEACARRNFASISAVTGGIAGALDGVSGAASVVQLPLALARSMDA
jgi:hypothetical protein